MRTRKSRRSEAEGDSQSTEDEKDGERSSEDGQPTLDVQPSARSTSMRDHGDPVRSRLCARVASTARPAQ